MDTIQINSKSKKNKSPKNKSPKNKQTKNNIEEMEKIEAETEADMAANRSNEAAANRYWEDRGWEDKFIEEDMGRSPFGR